MTERTNKAERNFMEYAKRTLEAQKEMPKIYTIPYDEYMKKHNIGLMEYYARLKEADEGKAE